MLLVLVKMSVERSIFSHSEKGSQMCSGEKFNGQKIQRLSFLDTGWCLEESSWLSNLGITCHAKVLFNFIVLTGMDAFGFFRWRIKQSGWNNDERGIPTTPWRSLKKAAWWLKLDTAGFYLDNEFRKNIKAESGMDTEC